VYISAIAWMGSSFFRVIVNRFVISHFACCLALLGTAVLCGCDGRAAPPQTAALPAMELGRDFDATTAGTISGQVTWHGTIPEPSRYRSPISPGNEHAGQPRHLWPNPNTPRIDPASKGVAGAVVFLRGVEPRRSRPWDHSAVRVELRDYQIHVCQGDRDDNTGFVLRGEAISMISRQTLFHSLHVRGAAFFARAFPDADEMCSRRLDRAGIIELSSGCGYFWMRGWLFVTDHPYYTATDAQGRFSLPQVPPGAYEFVCWLPDWHEASRELDAETALICRLTFRPPVEIVRSVQVDSGQAQTIAVQLDADRFGP
jgi:hypothetical protein